MDAQTLKLFAELGGIGGLGLAAFVVVFRDLGASTALNRLPPQAAYRMLRLVAICSFAIAAIGLSTWALSTFQKNGQARGATINQQSGGANSANIANVKGNIDYSTTAGSPDGDRKKKPH